MVQERRVGEFTTLETRGLANESVDKFRRYQQIIEILKENENGLTAKEVAVEMCQRGYTPTDERNFSSPRLTELLRNGVVDVIGKKKCSYTNKSVSVFKLLEKQTDIYDIV